MFSLIVGLIMFMLGLTFLWFGIWRDDKGLVTFLFVGGTIIITVSACEMSRPHINQPSQPTRLAARDTLYVVPKHSDQGVALIATQDSTGRPVIVVRDFVARHVIAPAIK